MNRLWKTSLEDEHGRPLNPTSTFTRFVFDPHGSRAYMGILRTILAGGILIFALTDFFGIDRITHAERKPNDPDRVWYWLRPHEWLIVLVFAYLVMGMRAAGFKRKESEFETDYKRTFLFMWNARVIFMPLIPTAFIFYFNVLRWNASNDIVFEFTLGFAFFTCCVELLVGAWPAEWIDVVMPTILGFAFLLITAMFSAFGVDLYFPLDWKNRPGVAATNALIFIVVLVTNAAVITGLAKRRNTKFGIGTPPPLIGLTLVPTQPPI